jgi:hypothetical protein
MEEQRVWPENKYAENLKEGRRIKLAEMLKLQVFP